MTDISTPETGPVPDAAEIPVEQLLADFDFFRPDHADRWQETLGYARGRCPVPYTSATGGYYIATRYDDVKRVLTDHETFSSTEYTNIAGNGGVRLPPIDTDPPLQHDFRSLLNPFFHPKRLAQNEDRVREIAVEATAPWIESGHCEVIEDFAGPFVTNVLARVVFEHDTSALFHQAAECNDRLAKGDPTGFVDFYALMVQYLTERSASSRPGAVVEAVSTGTVGGRPMTDEEKIGVVQILFTGGLDTTKVAIGDILLAIASDPTFEQRVRTPGWERNLLDEFMRFSSPVNAMGRIVTRDTELDGAQLRAGDRILVHFGSANHDAEMFECPDELVFDRQRNPHVAFGMGVHRCIGMHLARQQVRVAVDTILERVENLRVAPGAELSRRAGPARVLNALPLEFDLR